MTHFKLVQIAAISFACLASFSSRNRRWTFALSSATFRAFSARTWSRGGTVLGPIIQGQRNHIDDQVMERFDLKFGCFLIRNSRRKCQNTQHLRPARLKGCLFWHFWLEFLIKKQPNVQSNISKIYNSKYNSVLQNGLELGTTWNVMGKTTLGLDHLVEDFKMRQ